MTAWLCEFATADGLAGFVRLAVFDDTPAWFWTYLVGVPEHDGVIVVRDHEVPAPRQGLEIRAEGLWSALYCEVPDDHWTCGLEAFGVRLDDPRDALRPGGEIGERLPVGLDLEWEAPDVVHGDVLVARDQWTVDGWGRLVEGHELRDEVVPGEAQIEVLIPLGDGTVCARTLVRSADGAPRWSQRIREQ